MRLINADELRDIYSSVPNGVYTTGHIITAIDECKTVEAIPVKHGRWINSGFTYRNWEYKYVCSVCGGVECRTGCLQMKYCMFCGARMDLEEKDANRS